MSGAPSPDPLMLAYRIDQMERWRDNIERRDVWSRVDRLGDALQVEKEAREADVVALNRKLDDVARTLRNNTRWLMGVLVSVVVASGGLIGTIVSSGH